MQHHHSGINVVPSCVPCAFASLLPSGRDSFIVASTLDEPLKAIFYQFTGEDLNPWIKAITALHQSCWPE